MRISGLVGFFHNLVQSGSIYAIPWPQTYKRTAGTRWKVVLLTVDPKMGNGIPNQGPFERSGAGIDARTSNARIAARRTGQQMGLGFEHTTRIALECGRTQYGTAHDTTPDHNQIVHTSILYK
jgi:hypothetical protein